MSVLHRRNARGLARLVFIFAVVSLLAIPIIAQTTARVEGTVQDPTGAVVAGAKITATNIETHQVKEAFSNSAGLYVIPSVQPGKYTLSAEAAGFSKSVVDNLELNVSATTAIDFKLALGKATETVEVQATTVSVNTSDSTMGGAVTMKEIDTLPQLGRTPVTLSAFQPGVQLNPGDVTFSRVNGARQGSNNSRLDGIDVNDSVVPRLGLSLTANNTDSVGEFRMVTEGGKAEYGRNAGGQVEMITRSGTNTWHGSAFDYLRNKEMNANDYFNNQSAAALAGRDTRPKLTQNIWGGSVGGPILHSKTFVFGNFQRRDTKADIIRNRTVLTDSAKQGIFTWKDSTGALKTFNIAANDPRHKGIDPGMKTIFGLLPPSNNCDLGDGLNTCGFRFNNPNGSYEDQFTIRGDHNINSKMKAFIRWSWQRNFFADSLNNADATYPGQPQGWQGGHRWGFAVGHDWSITNSLVNEFRIGHQSANVMFARPARPKGPAIISASFTDPILPNFAQGRNSPVEDISDNMTFVKGNHTFKWGTTIRFTSQDGFNDAGIYPNVSLSTGNGNTAPSSIRPSGLTSSQTATFNNLYNDVLGRISSVTQTFYSRDLTTFQESGTPRVRSHKLRESGYYFQDDWKFRRNLTLNLGLRWEIFNAPFEADGIMGTLDKVSQITPTNQLTDLTVKRGNWYKTDFNNLAPRVGFAYDLFGDGKTSVRGNFGVFFDRQIGATVSAVDGATPGFAGSGSVTPNATGGDTRIADGIPVVPEPAAPVLQLPVANRPQDVFVFAPNLRTGYVESWQLGIQRELIRNTVLDVSYVGNRGVKLFYDRDYNQLHADGAFLQAFKELQAFRTSNTPVSSGNVIVKIFSPVTGLCTGSAAASPAACAINVLGGTNFDQALVGNVANTLDRTVTLNSRFAAAGLSQTWLRNYPQFNRLVVGTNDGRSYYDSLQVSLRRSAGMLKATVNYTYSKSIDNISVDGNGFTTPIDNFNVMLNKGLGDADHRHSFNASVIVTSPFGKGQRWLRDLPGWADRFIGGWQLGTLLAKQDGSLYTVSSQRATRHISCSTAGACSNTFADYKGGFDIGKITYHPDGTVTFLTSGDLANFTFPAAGTYGTSGRNNFRGPGFFSIDMSLVKRFPIWERHTLTFRAEAYNVLNNPNFGGLQTNLNNTATFGRLTSTVGGIQGSAARVLQVALRYDF